MGSCAQTAVARRKQETNIFIGGSLGTRGAAGCAEASGCKSEISTSVRITPGFQFGSWFGSFLLQAVLPILLNLNSPRIVISLKKVLRRINGTNATAAGDFADGHSLSAGGV